MCSCLAFGKLVPRYAKAPASDPGSEGTTGKGSGMESIAYRPIATTRQGRAIQLFHDAAFDRISKTPEVWVVETTYRSVNEVNLDAVTCTCKDQEHHGHIEGFMCKHLIAANLFSAWLRKSARDLSGYFGGGAGGEAA